MKILLAAVIEVNVWIVENLAIARFLVMVIDLRKAAVVTNCVSVAVSMMVDPSDMTTLGVPV